MKENNLKAIKIINAVTFLGMITVNALANILPINGIGTGDVSDAYPNLFAPAAITFSIWGVIYLLLALFVLYSFGVFKGKSGYSDDSIGRIKLCFAVSSIANTAWIFAWHYKKIGLALILMLIIFITLMFTYIRIRKDQLTSKEKIFVSIPFSVYFGWITIASIANIVTYLVSIGWNGFGIAEPAWMIIVVIVGLIIGGATAIKNMDIPYGLVIIWAYAGILIKHLSTSGFDAEYTGVIITVSVSIAILFISVIALLIKRIKDK